MSTELPKTYDPSSVETEAYRVWSDRKAFHAEPTEPGAPYSIVIPPPNVTAALHLGHALNNTLQDILTRWHRMMGDNTEWVPGTDHAGIATQTVVEKRVMLEEHKRRTDFSRDEFVAKIQKWKDEYEERITDQLKRMGCSCDWDRQAFTMDEPRARAVREAFFQLFKDGLIYRGKRLVNWDPVTQTALADDEVENEEVDGFFYYLRYPLVDGGHVTVATTRPETMLGDTAVAINPKDPRAASLRGKSVKLPIVNRIIPILEDDYVVMPDPNSQDVKAQFATGFLKVTPAHDPNDWEIGMRHSLDKINVMAPDASISDKFGWTDTGDAGFLLGKSREEARELVVKWFKEHGLLEEIKPYKHSVGHSYRSHVPIEPYLSDQWYCKVTDDRLRGAALRAMADDQIERSTGFQPVSGSVEHGLEARATGMRFYPARYAKTFQSWHENLRDWCISRQLWWGHRIPVWRLPEGRLSDRVSAEKFAEIVDQLFQWSREGRLALTHRGEAPMVRPEDIADRTLPFAFACVRDINDREIIDELELHGAVQDPDVLDTWFSSGLWPMSTLGWPDKTVALAKWNPTSVLCTAREIITLWVSRMTMFNLYFLNRLPFEHVFIHAMIQDGHGQKMSKSLGNGVDPVDIIHSHGADAMRFTLASMATNTQDVRMPVEMVDPHTNETFVPKYITDSAGHTVAAPIQDSPKRPGKKIVSSYGVASGKANPTNEMPVARNTSSKFDLGRNFCNKLWNAARFAMMNLSGEATKGRSDAATKESLVDRWIVSRFYRALAEAEAGLKEYRFDQYAKGVYDFFWGDFCDWYLEAIKPAMRDPARSAQTAQVLSAVLDASLRLMHPAIPFITETIWWKLNEVRTDRSIPALANPPSELLIKAKWPVIRPDCIDESAEAQFGMLQAIIVAIRNVRNDHKADPKKPVTVSIQSNQSNVVEENRQWVELLGVCKIRAMGDSIEAPPDSAKASVGGCDIYVEGLIDKEAEIGRLSKRRDDLARERDVLKGRLGNEGYIAKVPAKLVEQTRAKLAEVETKLAKLQ